MKVSMTALGCAKNQVDSERMLFMLREMGHEITDAQHAEAVIVVRLLLGPVGTRIIVLQRFFFLLLRHPFTR